MVSICHLLDLIETFVYPEISHGAFAGVDQNRALRIAISVAQCLLFLNEECQVMHGDVKHR